VLPITFIDADGIDRPHKHFMIIRLLRLHEEVDERSICSAKTCQTCGGEPLYITFGIFHL